MNLLPDGGLHTICPHRLVGAYRDALIPMQIVAGTAIVAIVHGLAVASAGPAAVAVATLGTADQPLEQPARTASPVPCALPILIELVLDRRKELLTDQRRHRDPDPLVGGDAHRRGQLPRVGGAPMPGTQGRRPGTVACLAIGGTADVCRVTEQLEEGAGIPPRLACLRGNRRLMEAATDFA